MAVQNEYVELYAINCPNNNVQWGIPYIDGAGNTQYNYNYFFKSVYVNGPGIYKARCLEGNHQSIADIIVHKAPGDGLYVIANKSKAKGDEAVTLYAYGCSNGTVKWKFGTDLDQTGFTQTRIGPGTYYAKCTDDNTTNKDWVRVIVMPNGTISPILTTTPTTACPNTPVTVAITPGSCPAGWGQQLRWLNDGFQTRFDADRGNIESMGVDYFTVFSFSWDATITQNGPRKYWARCVKPDYSYYTDFNDSFTDVDPAIPADFKVSSNSPIQEGNAIKIAATNIIGTDVVYKWEKWTNNAWVLINNATTRLLNKADATTADAGKYKCTVTANGGCTTSAEIDIAVKQCDIRINAIEPSTGIATVNLSKSTTTPNTFESLALSLMDSEGKAITEGSFAWDYLGPVSVPTQTNDFIMANKPGEYKVIYTPTGSLVGCGAKIGLNVINPTTYSYGLTRTTTLPGGIPAITLPIKTLGNNLTLFSKDNMPLSTDNTSDPKYQSRSLLYVYNQGGVEKRFIARAVPDVNYVKNRTSWSESTFTGKVEFFDESTPDKIRYWKYTNGVRSSTIFYNNLSGGSIQDDCIIFARVLVARSNYNPVAQSGWGAAAGGATKNDPLDTFGVSVADSYGFNFESAEIIGGTIQINMSLPCVLSNNVPVDFPPSNLPWDPNNPNSPPLKGPINEGQEAGTNPNPFAYTDCVSRITNIMKGITTNLLGGATKVNPDTYKNGQENIVQSERKVKLLINLIRESMVKNIPAITRNNFQTPTDASITAATNNLIFVNKYKIGKLDDVAQAIMAGIIPTVNCSNLGREEDIDELIYDTITPEVTKNFNALSKLLDDCDTDPISSSARIATTPCAGETIAYEILNSFISRNKSIVDKIQYFDNEPYMEEQEINDLWADLSSGYTPTNKPDGTKEVIKDGTTITYTPPTATTSAKIIIERDDSKVVIEADPINNKNENTNEKAKGIAFTDNFKHNEKSKLSFQNILETETGKKFIGQFMKNGESITIITKTKGKKVFNFTENGINTENKLILNCDKLNPNIINGQPFDVLAFTNITEKNNYYSRVGLNENYDLNNGYSVLIYMNTENNEIDMTGSMCHEFFVHAQKSIDKINSGKPFQIGSIKYKSLIKCILNSEDPDHGQLAREEVNKFKQIAIEIDDINNNANIINYYNQNVLKNAPYKNTPICN